MQQTQQKTKANAGRLDKSRRSQPRENAERLLLKRKLTCDEAGNITFLHIESIMLYLLYRNTRSNSTMTNRELAKYVSIFLDQERGRKVDVAKKLGIHKQTLNNMFKKTNFSLDDANKILNAIGYKLDTKIKITEK